MASIQNSEVVFDYMESPQAFSEEIREVVEERTEQLEKIDKRWPAVSSRLELQRFFARTDFVTSKTSISRKSRPGSATPFKGSLPDRLVFRLSTLSTSQVAMRVARGNNIVSLRSSPSGADRADGP